MSHKQLITLRVNGEVVSATASNLSLFSAVEMEVVLLLRPGLTYMMLRDIISRFHRSLVRTIPIHKNTRPFDRASRMKISSQIFFDSSKKIRVVLCFNNSQFAKTDACIPKQLVT